MKRRMVLGVVCMMLAAATVGLAGCPALGIGGNSTLGKIVVHNDGSAQYNERITSLSAVHVPDECSDQKPKGVNLIPEPILIGQSFTIADLPEGRYYCKADVYYTGGDYTTTGYVTVAAGGTVDWYVQ